MNSDITFLPFCCCGELHLLDHCPAAARKLSSIPGQPPSTSLRIEAPASAPIASNLRCSSSTTVASGPSIVKRTSTSEPTVVSGFQRWLMSQLTMKRFGGSQRRILPTVASEPSSPVSYQRPPRRGSIVTAFIGEVPIVPRRGHQRSSPAVNTSKACAWLALTRTLLRTGAMVTVLFMMLCLSHEELPLPIWAFAPPRRERQRARRPRIDRARTARPRAHAGRWHRRAACPLRDR